MTKDGIVVTFSASLQGPYECKITDNESDELTFVVADDRNRIVKAMVNERKYPNNEYANEGDG